MKSRIVQNLAVPVLVFFSFHEVCGTRSRYGRKCFVA